MDKGSNWEAISDDLTTGGKSGNVAYGTITSVSESSFQFGLIYCGSDDGLVQVTKNGGGNWTNVSAPFPKDLWVSRVTSSTHKKERVYVTLNGYRWDDFEPYVYTSDNYGATWKSISGNLPASSINVIKEDPVNENVLYLGADNGAYVSINRGESWEAFSNGLPNVAVHDMVVQEKAKDLVVGTHGRSIYTTNISLLQQLNSGNMNGIVIGEILPIDSSRRWGNSWSQWSEVYEPSEAIQFYAPQAGKATILIETEEGKEVQQLTCDTSKGVNVVNFDMSVSEKGKKNLEKAGLSMKKAKNDKYYLPVGKYKVKVSMNGMNSTNTMEVK
jgi:hypothetical protein